MNIEDLMATIAASKCSTISVDASRFVTGNTDGSGNYNIITLQLLDDSGANVGTLRFANQEGTWVHAP